MPPEVTWRLPRAMATTIMALLTTHPYNQVAEILHVLQTQLNEPAPQPGKLGGGDGAA